MTLLKIPIYAYSLLTRSQHVFNWWCVWEYRNYEKSTYMENTWINKALLTKHGHRDEEEVKGDLSILPSFCSFLLHSYTVWWDPTDVGDCEAICGVVDCWDPSDVVDCEDPSGWVTLLKIWSLTKAGCVGDGGETMSTYHTWRMCQPQELELAISRLLLNTFVKIELLSTDNKVIQRDCKF